VSRNWQAKAGQAARSPEKAAEDHDVSKMCEHLPPYWSMRFFNQCRFFSTRFFEYSASNEQRPG
jgi:hypothetical protein